MARPNREIRDKNGNIRRTDHPTMGDVVRDVVNRITRGGLKTDDRTKHHVDEATSKLKKKQDKEAGITRRA